MSGYGSGMLKIIGAGLPRTGTMSQSEAFPVLLGGKCYHMREVMNHPEHVDTWIDATAGIAPDWDALFDGYTAAVDWPASAFWEELAEVYPDALILLSTRTDAATWYRSMSNTVLKAMNMRKNGDWPQPPPGAPVPPARFDEMGEALWRRFVGPDTRMTTTDAEGAQRKYDEHVRYVRETAPADRLLEWNVAQGWGPLCERLGVAVPDQPFPRVNSTADFEQMLESALGAKTQ